MMFIGRSMIVICSAPIRIIIWIVSTTAITKNAMRTMSTSVDSARPALRRQQPVQEVDVDVARAAHGGRDRR